MKTYSSSTLLGEREEEQSSQEYLQEQYQVSASKKEMFGTNIIGWVLQGGVMLSATIIALGLLLLPLRSGGLSLQ